MAAEDAIKAVLLSSASVSALAADRIWKKKLPQSAILPAVVYRRISTTPGAHGLEGQLGPMRCRLEISAWAQKDDQATQLGGAVREALKNWSGIAGGQPVQLVRLVGWFDDYEAGPPERFRVISDFYVFSMEGVAA